MSSGPEEGWFIPTSGGDLVDVLALLDERRDTGGVPLRLRVGQHALHITTYDYVPGPEDNFGSFNPEIRIRFRQKEGPGGDLVFRLGDENFDGPDVVRLDEE